MKEDKRKNNGKNLFGEDGIFKYKGEKHGNWKGGIKKDHKLQYQLRKKRHPLKVKVQQQLNNAVYNGKIEKPNKCEKCNKVTEKRKIDGHHEDYTKPFEVKWLCKQCHNQVHKGYKQLWRH